MSRLQLACCYSLIAIGLLFALCSAAHRVKADQAYRDVLVLVDWHSLNALPPSGVDAELSAAATGTGPLAQSSLDLLKAIPGAQVCYGEETIGTLLAQSIIQPAWLTTGSQAFMVIDGRYAGDIARGVDRHGYLSELSDATDGRLTFMVPELPQEELMLLPVAWCQEVIEAVSAAGFEVVLRPGGSEFMGEDGIQRTLDFCANQDLVLFHGPTVLGYPGRLNEVADILKAQGQQFGWVEFDEQDGGAQLAAKLSPAVVRVHSIPPEEMVNYTAATAADRFVRAVQERNIRCVYLRPFVRGPAADATDAAGYRQELAAYNHEFFGLLQTELADAGFKISGAVAAPQSRPAWLGQVLPLTVTLAVGAAFVLLLAMWLPGWPQWVWWLFIAVSAAKGVAAMYMPMVQTAVLLAAALVFPLWGFWWALTIYMRITDRLGCKVLCPRRIFVAMFALVIASLASIAGGVLIHGALWDAATMLKVGQFRGVTVALAVPVLLLASYAWQAETLQDAYSAATRRLTDYWQRFMQLWSAPIRYGDVAFILIAVGALAIVLLRSGNDSPLEILSVETWFRGSLEDWFTLRPRTKELIGHPLLIIFLLSIPWRTRLSLLFGLAALLGQVSVLNTFCHLHTPLLVTMERVLLGLGLGLASGLIWGAVVLILAHIWRFIKGKLFAASTTTT